MHILMVENDEAVTRIWSRWFSREHTVAVADCVKVALAEIDKHMPDMVFLDLRLNGPDTSGLDVYTYLRNTLGQDVPILFITGLEYNVELYMKAQQVAQDDVEKGLNTQMLKKPVSIKEMSSLVSAVA